MKIKTKLPWIFVVSAVFAFTNTSLASDEVLIQMPALKSSSERDASIMVENFKPTEERSNGKMKWVLAIESAKPKRDMFLVPIMFDSKQSCIEYGNDLYNIVQKTLHEERQWICNLSIE